MDPFWGVRFWGSCTGLVAPVRPGGVPFGLSVRATCTVGVLGLARRGLFLFAVAVLGAVCYYGC